VAGTFGPYLDVTSGAPSAKRRRHGGEVRYALIPHRDPAVPAARGTVVLNPGGPGLDVIGNAANWTELLAGLVSDHDLLLIDPRGTGRSHPLDCGVTEVPATRRGFVHAIARCGRALGPQARAYTSAATADDFEAVRAHLGIPKLDLFGVSYGTYLLTVFAQRHPTSVRSIALSSAFPLRFDMWARANARAVRLAIRRVCARSTRPRWPASPTAPTSTSASFPGSSGPPSRARIGR
jgi:pimeloyl-ACP methyl ester carboxylesterase